MSENALKPGDVVMLKSGGPQMTVTALGQGAWTGTVYTKWFDGSVVKDGEFPAEALEIDE